MSTSPGAIFTGSSQFSTDFANVIQRAVQFAQLPMQQTQNDVTALTSQSSELTTLGGDFTRLQSALTSLNTALGSGSFNSSATSSVTGSNVASVTLSGTPGVGTYTLEVDTIGSYASALSNSSTTVADPTTSNISNANVFMLAVGQSSYNISNKGGTLSSLASAINASGAGVQATVVNLGSTASPAYQLSIQNSHLAAATIQLTAVNGSAPNTTLLEQQATGAPATYRVDGKPASPADPLTSDSSVLTLSPGVTVTMLTPGTSTISVTQNTNAVSSAFSTFVSAYNSVQAELGNNRGSGTGALKGQSTIMSLSQTLGQIVNYSSGNSGISMLAALGVTYSSNADGTLTFDSSKFGAATDGQIQQLSTFLGSTTTNGFLKMANDALTSITDTTDGLIANSYNTIQGEITADNQKISDQQDKVTKLQTTLTQQMAAADAAISAMEQQYSYLYSMFQAMQVNSQNGG